MTNNISNTANCQKPSFCGLKIFGTGAEKYLKERAAAEGEAAVKKAVDTIDSLRDWGYVNLNKTPKKDTFILQGHSDDASAAVETTIKSSEPLNGLVSKIKFLAENNRTFK